MYLQYWKLEQLPFENTANPKFFFNSKQHEEALSRLHYVVDNRKGATMLTGVFGCGKTLLARRLFNELKHQNYEIAIINNPQLKAIELLRSIARNLGNKELPFKFSDMSADYFLEVIENTLINNAKDGRRTLLIVDEAHVITELEVLEELRLLLNFQLDEEFLLTLVLMGQPELQDKVAKTKQLLQRIALSYHIGPLSEAETDAYVSHRLTVSGAKARIFAPEAVRTIHKMSGGIPRRINHICDLCLFVGASAKAPSVNGQVAQEAVASFEVH